MKRTIGAAALLLFTLCAVASAGPPGTWTTVGVRGTERPVGVIGLARTSDNVLHVAWVARIGGNSYDLLETPVSPNGRVGAPNPIVTGWAGLGDVALVAQGQQLSAFFPGARTTQSGEPYFGLNLATNSGGGWALSGPGSIYTGEFAYGRTPSVTNVGGTFLETWNGRDGQVVHVGLDPNSGVSIYGPAQCCNLGQNIASAGNEVWVAWCSQNDAASGRWVERIDAATGQPQGGPIRLAGSQGLLCESAGREPLVARTGGGFYVADASGGSSGTKVVLWRIGGRAITVTRSSDSHSRVALAADPDGRLWVAWRTFHGADVIHLRRSNRAATRFGPEVRIRAPKGAVEVSSISLDAQARLVDVLATYSFANSSQNNLFHTQALPKLTLTATGGRESASFKVTDAGDPVPNATVRIAGEKKRTDSHGRAKVAVDQGSYTASATAPSYVGDTAHVKVRPARRRKAGG